MWDTPYGNYSDFDEYHWSDDFLPTSEQSAKVASLFEDFLEEAAAICNLDTDEWDSDEFDIFREVMGI